MSLIAALLTVAPVTLFGIVFCVAQSRIGWDA